MSDAFKADELERLAYYNDPLAAAVGAVNWGGAPKAVIHQFIECLEKGGAIHDTFFSLLESELPARAHEIHAIRDAWRLAAADGSKPAGDPADPVASPRPAKARGPSNVPPQALKDLFVGRRADLEKLHESLQDPQDAATVLVGKAVHGLGGVGKTRLAVEYARRHADDYSARLFVVADSKASLWQNVSNLAGNGILGLPERDAREQETKIQAVIAWLERHPGWLLILDNVDSEEVAEEVKDRLLPQLKEGSVLITSRLSWWGNHVEAIELDVLPLDVAVQFLLERTKLRSGGQGRIPQPSDEQNAETLAKELGSLALALEQAGAYIVNQRITLAEYIARWKKHDAEIHDWTDKRSQEQKCVGTTYQTTLAQLGRQEIAVLNLLAWMAPEPIPLFVLGADDSWKNRPQEQQPRNTDAAAEICLQAIDLLAPGNAERTSGRALRESIGILVDFSMLRWDATAGTMTVHRVVQEILRTRQGERGTQWLTLALRLLDAACPAPIPSDVRTWPAWDLLRPHVTSAAAEAHQRQIADPTADLMGRLGLVLGAKALHREKERWERRALAIDEKVYGRDSPQVATRLNNLAQTLQNTNRLAEAEPLMRRALTIGEQSDGPQHPKVALRLSNLALLLQEANRLAEAEPLMRRALAIDERSSGPHHSDVATDLINLAVLLKATNRLAEAEPLIRRALAIDEQSYGSQHPEVAIDLNNLALLLQETNRLAEAEPLMRRALAIDEQSYGLHHPNVARDLNNLSLLLQETNRLAEAEPLMRRALAIGEQSDGPQHPNVAIRLNNLAQLLHSTNRLAEAEPLMRRALAIDEQSYGPHHPDVAIRLNNLAHLLRATNRLAEAEPLMRRVVEIRRDFVKASGHPQPRLQASVENYRQLLAAMDLPEDEINLRVHLALDEPGTGSATV